MSESESVARAEAPRTCETLTREIRALELPPGVPVLVHTRLSSLGWVCGGAPTLVRALIQALAPVGTLVMPAFSSGMTEPRHWRNPAVPEEWWPTIRAEMPAYDPELTPVERLGVTPPLFARWPGTLRSGHPCSSFAARGPLAPEVVGRHALEDSLGEDGPLGALDRLGAWVLFLGTGWETCTAFHLGEARWGGRPWLDEGSPLLQEGERVWREYRNRDYDSSRFGEIGAAFEASEDSPVRVGRVGSALVRSFPLSVAAAFAETWMGENLEPGSGSRD